MSAPATVRAGRCSLTGRVAVRIAAGGDRPVLASLECDGALAARSTPAGLYLVGAGAHPIGDDRLEVHVELEADASLTVRSVGATLARRGRPGGRSETSHHVVLAPGSTLRWLVEPGVAAAGAQHLSSVALDASASARVFWREEIVLGRHGEQVPGSWRATMALRHGGRPLLVTDLDLGPDAQGWKSPSVTCGARAVVCVVLVDPELEGGGHLAVTLEGRAARAVRCPLAGPGVEILAWGADLRECRGLADALLAQLRCAWAVAER